MTDRHESLRGGALNQSHPDIPSIASRIYDKERTMNITDYIKPVSGLKYYVLMKDFGGKIGFGADVAPEYSRRQIVQEVCDEICKGRAIVHVKFQDGNDNTDVTHEIVAEALALKAKDDAENDELDRIYYRQQAERDHARDHRKNWVA